MPNAPTASFSVQLEALGLCRSVLYSPPVPCVTNHLRFPCFVPTSTSSVGLLEIYFHFGSFQFVQQWLWLRTPINPSCSFICDLLLRILDRASVCGLSSSSFSVSNVRHILPLMPSRLPFALFFAENAAPFASFYSPFASSGSQYYQTLHFLLKGTRFVSLHAIDNTREALSSVPIMFV